MRQFVAALHVPQVVEGAHLCVKAQLPGRRRITRVLVEGRSHLIYTARHGSGRDCATNRSRTHSRREGPPCSCRFLFPDLGMELMRSSVPVLSSSLEDEGVVLEKHEELAAQNESQQLPTPHHHVPGLRQDLLVVVIHRKPIVPIRPKHLDDGGRLLHWVETHRGSRHDVLGSHAQERTRRLLIQVAQSVVSFQVPFVDARVVDVGGDPVGDGDGDDNSEYKLDAASALHHNHDQRDR
mmetsp:Transcript_15463/g.21336  ORF Transcript_15463/g.21336 Transcript_15463/m.21336 type:complete len:238 (+) Transcript_15463:418-1131(+)